MWTNLFLGIIIVSLGAILFIILRKFPYLAAIDTSTIPKEKQAKVKEQILLDRVQRKTKTWWEKHISRYARPTAERLSGWVHAAYSRLQEMEKQYQKTLKEQVKESGADIDQRIMRLLREAEDFVKEEKYADAEKRYIEMISLDVKNADAYRGLGNLYFLNKDYVQAKETLEHLVKIAPEMPGVYLELAGVYKALENLEKALENAKKAAEFDPNHPKTLDFLLEIAILSHNRSLAEETFAKLKEVNPENEKLEGLETKIKEMESGSEEVKENETKSEEKSEE